MKSCKAIYSISTAVLCVVLAVTGTSAVWAQARTTQVEVNNQVGIDPANNTVKAEQSGSWLANVAGTLAATQSGIWNVGITGIPYVAQSGTWNVGLTGDPSVSIAGTPNVNVANTPTVNITGTPNVNVANTPTVSIAGTPNVNVTNTPTVNISSTNNTVKAPTQWNKIQLWTTNQVLPDSMGASSPYLTTTGYKEIRACIESSSSNTNLKVHLLAKNGAGAYSYVATGSFAVPTANFISLGGNLTCPTYSCIFSFPVIADMMYIVISNLTGGSITVFNTSWVYLVN